MKNVEVKVVKGKIIIEIDTTKEFGLSSSGKSMIVASTEGNQLIEGTGGCKIGLNIYKSVPKNA